MLKGVILDFGGVMTTPPFRGHEIPEQYAGLLSFMMAEFNDYYHVHGVSHDLHLLETGKIGELEFFGGLCRRYLASGGEVIDPAEARHHIYSGGLNACEPMISTVRHLRAAGLRTGLLTNISRDPIRGYREILPVSELFDAVVDSSEVGLRKPNPEIYHHACSSLGLLPHECLFVDDLHCNVNGAMSIGMKAWRCSDPEAMAARLLSKLVVGKELTA